ncbi:DUF456 domain-containing protein [Arthrobacter zhangbolii]|uniref:DUF456 domain-containing protein n=1 Tax=Arthrobacter zhangbolii TaxID=2886936 RepID=A0A9X1M7H5_9MICC|nr:MULTISPECIES: DUF456 domain-containing protein [Arthrobacter]MCC3272300.1 DUF456 domain-containing protein [Arthrobacter zhangbolii]MCC3294220.1 DUF456 domain-containing protein [Arthrobacter zhangbolii]MDN3903364.1 DUF456 domain-containing protein [Arthrobacter sp. YD2]UON91835.1 DUF456 domain-containing protein [Arthrobacter zhangbolii]
MDPDLLVTLAAALVIAVGLTGIVVPVLPGSILIIIALLGWAFGVQSPAGWWAFGIGAVLLVAGMLASFFLTGRRLKQRQIPTRSIVAGVVLGVVGMFTIPAVGLFVGFAAGLLLSEWQRQRNLSTAWSSSLATLKAMGIGILAELALALTAGGIWGAGVWVHFATR